MPLYIGAEKIYLLQKLPLLLGLCPRYLGQKRFDTIQLGPGMAGQQVIDPYSLLDAYLFGPGEVFLLSKVSTFPQFLPGLVEFLQQSVDISNIFLPDNITAADGGCMQQSIIIWLKMPVPLQLGQYRPIQRAGTVGAIAYVFPGIDYLRRQ